MEAVYKTKLGKLFGGDCLLLLKSLQPETVDLVFADPPFNLRKNYGPNITDDLNDKDYLDWCRQWIDGCVKVLKPGGAIFLWNLPKWNVELGHILSDLGMSFRHWIAVDIKYTLPIPGRLYPSHYSLLYYTKGKPERFVRPRVPVPVCRHCGGDIKDYGGHRDKLNPAGLNLADVWTDIAPVRHRTTKTRHSNQLSPKLLRRILEIATVTDDLVLDPFGGSGTTYVVAEEMGRRWIGVEIGDPQSIIDRLEGKTFQIVKNIGDAGKGLRRSFHAAGARKAG